MAVKYWLCLCVVILPVNTFSTIALVIAVKYVAVSNTNEPSELRLTIQAPVKAANAVKLAGLSVN